MHLSGMYSYDDSYRMMNRYYASDRQSFGVSVRCVQNDGADEDYGYRSDGFSVRCVAVAKD